MIITSINLNGLDLISNDYYFALSGLFDIATASIFGGDVRNGTEIH